MHGGKRIAKGDTINPEGEAVWTRRKLKYPKLTQLFREG
jgi:hypothetical protein